MDETNLHWTVNNECPHCIDEENRKRLKCPGYILPCISKKRILLMEQEFIELLEVCQTLIFEAPVDTIEILRTTFQDLEFTLIFEKDDSLNTNHEEIQRALEYDGIEFKLGKLWLKHKVTKTIATDCTFCEMLKQIETEVECKFNLSPYRFHMLVIKITENFSINIQSLCEKIYTLNLPLNFIPLLYFTEDNIAPSSYDEILSELQFGKLLDYCFLYKNKQWKFGAVITAIINFRYRFFVNMLFQIIENFNPEFDNRKLLVRKHFDGIIEHLVPIIVNLLKYQNSMVDTTSLGETSCIPFPEYFLISRSVEQLYCHILYNLVVCRTSDSFFLQLARTLFFIGFNFRITHSNGQNISTADPSAEWRFRTHFAGRNPNKLDKWLYRTFLQDQHFEDGIIFLIKSCVNLFEINNGNFELSKLFEIPGVAILILAGNCLLNKYSREYREQSDDQITPVFEDHFSSESLEEIKTKKIFSLRTLHTDVQEKIIEKLTVDPAILAQTDPSFYTWFDNLRTDQTRRSNLSRVRRNSGFLSNSEVPVCNFYQI